MTDLPIWVSECGASSFGAEEVQEFGLRRTAELLIGRASRIHWYSLFDLPQAWPATTRHKEAEGSSYYRHFYMGLLREDGTPKRVAAHFADFAPISASANGFILRTIGSIWRCMAETARCSLPAHWAQLGRQLRPDAEAWFDRQMRALEPFDVT